MNVAKYTKSAREQQRKTKHSPSLFFTLCFLSFMYFLSFFSVLSFLFEIYLSVNFQFTPYIP